MSHGHLNLSVVSERQHYFIHRVKEKVCFTFVHLPLQRYPLSNKAL